MGISGLSIDGVKDLEFKFGVRWFRAEGYEELTLPPEAQPLNRNP